MSLIKKREPTTKKITIVGSEADMKTLGDVLQQAYTMFNIDLDVTNKDLPHRITLREKSDPEAIDYPRTAKVLKSMSKVLSEDWPHGVSEKSAPVWFGDMDWKFREPALSVAGREVPDIVRVMQSISEGRSVGGLPAMRPGKYYAGYNLKEGLDNGMKKGKIPDNMDPLGLFGTLKPNWVYLQTVDIAPLRSRFLKGKKQHDSPEELIEMEKGRLAGTPGKEMYPADLGEIKLDGFKKGEATQAYVGIFRGDFDFDINQIIEYNHKDWNTLIKRIPKDLLSKELREKPKTVGALLEVYFAYNVASTMKLKNAAVRPVAPGRAKVFTELMVDKGEGPTQPEQAPGRAPLGEKVLYSAIVVGTGKYIPGSYNVSNLEQANVPGWN